MERQRVRMFFSGPPTAAQLRVLRVVFPPLGAFPPATLRQRLGALPVCVLEREADGDAAQALSRLAAAGLAVEACAHHDYGAPYLRRLLPAPPASWDETRSRLECVFYPSFDPEVILRLWLDGARARMQLSSRSAPVLWEHFMPQLSLDKPSEPPPVPTGEVADVEPIDGLLSRALLMREQPHDPGGAVLVDGMNIQIATRRGSQTNETYHGATDPAARELLGRILALGSARLQEPQSRRHIEALQRYVR